MKLAQGALPRLFPSKTGTIGPSETGTIVPKWDWCHCSKVTLAKLFPRETDTVVPKRDWHDCSQGRLAQLFPNNTGIIVPKWHWHGCSQVRLVRLFLSETGTIAPKWHWHNCSQVILDFDFLIYTLFCSLFFGTILHYWVSLGEQLCHVPGLWHMIGFQLYGLDDRSFWIFFCIEETFFTFRVNWLVIYNTKPDWCM